MNEIDRIIERLGQSSDCACIGHENNSDLVAYLERLKEPSEAMWNGLARDIVMFERMYHQRPTGKKLYEHLNNTGTPAPDWLRDEIPDIDHVPPKGTIAVVIWKAMLTAAGEGK